MAQLKFFLDVPGAGRLGLMGQIAHNMSLGSGQFHGFQCAGHRLIGAPMEDPEHVSIMVIQKDHLPNENVARYLSF